MAPRQKGFKFQKVAMFDDEQMLKNAFQLTWEVIASDIYFAAESMNESVTRVNAIEACLDYLIQYGGATGHQAEEKITEVMGKYGYRNVIKELSNIVHIGG